MRGRLLVLTLASIVALPIGSALAQGAEDIEMEGDPPADPPPDPLPVDPPVEDPPADPPTDAPAPVVKDPKAAKKWHDAGKQLVQKGDYNTRKNKLEDAKAQYENAVTAFEKAIETGDDVGVHYDLGIVNEKLGKLEVAAKNFRTVVNAKAGVKPDVMKKATAKWDDLSTKVGLLTLTITTEETTVSLAGNEIGKSPLPEALILAPGTYTFSFASDGYQPKDVEIKVEAGSESERTIELEPIKIVVEPPKVDTTEPVEVVKPKPPNMLPIYIGGGVAAAALLTTVVTGIVASSHHGTFTAADSTFDEREDARVSGENMAVVSDVFLVTTVVAAGFTGYWYWFKYRPALKKFKGEDQPAPGRPGAPNPDDISSTIRRAPVAAKVHLVPWVKTDAGGLSFAGSF
jgi:hypothetical protein